MIIPNDIKENELINVLVEDIGETIAKVSSNEGNYLLVSYLSQSNKTYKGTRVYSFEIKTEYVSFDSLITHYIDTVDLEEIGFIKVQDNMFVEESDIDDESSSEVETASESECESEDSFIVPDNEEVCIKPVDYKEVDKNWDSWKPTTPGAKRFKDKVDMMEKYMNNQIDEKFVF